MMWLLQGKLHYLPIFTAIFIISAFFLSYGVSVYYGHVEPDFPYISYAAIQAPERCIFAQLINFGALLLAANIYIRYLHISKVLVLRDITGKYRAINTASLVLGLISAFGLSMVANFQTVEMRPGHYTGAGLAFILGAVYCWLQTLLSVRYSRWSLIAVWQLIHTMFLSLFLIIFIISKTTYKVRESWGHGTKWDTLRVVYLVSTSSEWLTAGSIVTFVLTFYRDFSRTELKLPTVEIHDRTTVEKDYRMDSIVPSGDSTTLVVEGNGHTNGAKLLSYSAKNNNATTYI